MTNARTKEREPTPDLLKDVTPKAEAKASVIAPAKPLPKKPAAAKPKNEIAKVERHPPADVAPNMLLVIARAAADKDVNPDKMRALLDMQKEIRAEEARIAFTEAFIEMSAELPVINAKGRIEIEAKAGKKGQSTPYATFNEINRVTKPILHRRGFALWCEPDFAPDGRIIVHGHLDHKGGHGKSCSISMPLETSGSKNNVQGVGSSLSYGKRYCAIALLNLVSEALEDRDDDGHAAGKKGAKAEPETKEVVFASALQITEMEKAIEDCGVGLEVVCNKYQIDALRELPSEMVPAVLKACATFKANQEAKRAHG